MSGDSTLKNAKPLFLIGAPRSGTTILAKLLNAHSEVLLTNETAVFLQLNEMILKSEKGSPSGILYGKTHNRLWAHLLRRQAKEMIETFYAQVLLHEEKGSVKYWEKNTRIYTPACHLSQNSIRMQPMCMRLGTRGTSLVRLRK